MKEDFWEYECDAKYYTRKGLISSAALTIIAIVLAVCWNLFQIDFGKENNFIIYLYFFIAVSFISFIQQLNQYFFYKICIGKNGFYIRTNPFNGYFYRFADIRNAYVEVKEIRVRYHGRRKRYALIFTTVKNEMRKIYFENDYYRKNIDTIISRSSQTKQ
ncbi:MAG: hypothetical protein IJ447_04535 [Clostridia bacterium]|nr:hypothetical protein [Clostridia bacterium]